MRVRYTPRARSDLRGIIQYLGERNPQAARNVKRAMANTVRLIAQFPHGGRVAGEQYTRVLPVGPYPYLIYWSIEGDEAWIVHIRDGRRKPWRGV